MGYRNAFSFYCKTANLVDFAAQTAENSRPGSVCDPGYMSRKNRKFRTDKFDSETNGNSTQATHVNGLFPAVYRSCFSPNFCLYAIEFIRSKLWNFSAHVSGVSSASVCDWAVLFQHENRLPVRARSASTVISTDQVIGDDVTGYQR